MGVPTRTEKRRDVLPQVKLGLEFRFEAYNVTNTPSFRNPGRDIAAANFGQITRMRGGPRVIQLGLKFRF